MTSRLLDFVGRRELIAQIGHGPDWWPAGRGLKELLDNAFDAAEEAELAPEVVVGPALDGSCRGVAQGVG